MAAGESADIATKDFAYVQFTMQVQLADEFEFRAAIGACMPSRSFVHETVPSEPGAKPRGVVAELTAEHVTLLFRTRHCFRRGPQERT